MSLKELKNDEGVNNETKSRWDRRCVWTAIYSSIFVSPNNIGAEHTIGILYDVPEVFIELAVRFLRSIGAFNSHVIISSK